MKLGFLGISSNSRSFLGFMVLGQILGWRALVLEALEFRAPESRAPVGLECWFQVLLEVTVCVGDTDLPWDPSSSRRNPPRFGPGGLGSSWQRLCYSLLTLIR